MKRNSKRIHKKHPPKQTKPNDQDDFKGKLLEMFGFDIDTNINLQNLDLQQYLLDAMVEKGLITDEVFFQPCF